MTTPQQRNCQLLYPGWATTEKAGYQCCMGAMAPAVLRRSASAQARHVVQHCPGKAIDRTKIAQLETAEPTNGRATDNDAVTRDAKAAVAALEATKALGVIERPIDSRHEAAKGLKGAAIGMWVGAGSALAMFQPEAAVPLAIGALATDAASWAVDDH
jgi:hypothetical protein